MVQMQGCRRAYGVTSELIIYWDGVAVLKAAERELNGAAEFVVMFVAEVGGCSRVFNKR